MKFITAIISLLTMIILLLLYYVQAHDQTCTDSEDQCTGIPNQHSTVGARTTLWVNCIGCHGLHSTCYEQCGIVCNKPDCIECSTCVNETQSNCPQMCHCYCACSVSNLVATCRVYYYFSQLFVIFSFSQIWEHAHLWMTVKKQSTIDTIMHMPYSS